MIKYQNKLVQHSYNCHSVKCLCSRKKHVATFYVYTEHVNYVGQTATAAMKMWAADGQKTVIDIGRLG